MSWKNNRITDIDKMVFKLLASNSKTTFRFKEISEFLNITEDQVYNSLHRLEAKGLAWIDWWQVIIIDGKEYDLTSDRIKTREGVGFSNGKKYY